MTIQSIPDTGGNCLDLLKSQNTPRRALVVEDDAAVLDFINRSLQLFGFAVHQAANGREAVAAFMQEPFDLVITDYKMPIMDGLTLIKKIRVLAPLTPIILMSGATWEVICQTNTMPQISAYLSKPFTLDHLHDTVERTCASIGPRRRAFRQSV